VAYIPHGFALGGLFGYYEDYSTLKQGNCAEIADYANNAGNIISGGLRNFCLVNQPKCLSEIAIDEFWGNF